MRVIAYEPEERLQRDFVGRHLCFHHRIHLSLMWGKATSTHMTQKGEFLDGKQAFRIYLQPRLKDPMQCLPTVISRDRIIGKCLFFFLVFLSCYFDIWAWISFKRAFVVFLWCLKRPTFGVSTYLRYQKAYQKGSIPKYIPKSKRARSSI